ncbi:MAG: peptide-methionine (R)-S-oxide reductase [Vampirovibrionales bacterium]|nr:peptide-methionine (R)-S-oxide reductase [Vampirovibrionales bacterium]
MGRFVFEGGRLMHEPYKNHWEAGRYACAKCGAALFESEAKFNSGTAWPSFRACVPESINETPDDSHGMSRTEILCKKCGLHLGHVFNDGQWCGDTHPDANLRYCVLSEALTFKPEL